MKKLGFIVLLAVGSIAAQAQAPADPAVDVLTCQIKVQLANDQINSAVSALARHIKENEALRTEVARLKEELKAKTEKPSN